ncbi:MAG: tRNA uridine-5-carboxymethylaminomethyl(34) synthesis enzyme MnmG [Veillonellaceae bacterium]|nr:tRNA uridine-5-carboxymethylaminomethyl(34) synthesis enzyme MnmG [Veillonellaceae bacterium]
MLYADQYDVIVIGAGHAGCEAALAAARIGCSVLLVTLNLDNIAMMPCNPSVGGPAKGHLVREIDAMGGEMGIAADRASIQMRMLNTAKGPAVHALRAQADKLEYQKAMRLALADESRLQVRQLLVEQLLFEGKTVTGIVTETGERIGCSALVLATGTYLRGRVIIGDVAFPGGPNGQRAAVNLSASLLAAGIRLRRFKTGTPARIDRQSVDFSKMQIQPGDKELHNFSFLDFISAREQVPCWLTYTTPETHRLIRENLHRAPLYSGQIEGTGPRYCPSIEVKIVNFPDKESHQVFIEPEGLSTPELYVQGMSTSLPTDVQVAMLRSIPGLEQARIMRYGYAIEYDCIDPTQLDLSLAFKNYPGLFAAGQVNGSSGYEEAAAQGLIAGINAARLVQGLDPVLISRAEGYIGVLIDDLVTKGTNEPYRIMTSRAEYRLLLRHDNADLRLTRKGHEAGLASPLRWQRTEQKRRQIETTLELLKQTIVSPSSPVQERLREQGSAELRTGISAYDLLKRPNIGYADIRTELALPELSPEVVFQVEVMIKYEGYIKKQIEQVQRAAMLEDKVLPTDLDYAAVRSLSNEARQKLSAVRPVSIGQASRISGVSPADISLLLIYTEQMRRRRNGG